MSAFRLRPRMASTSTNQFRSAPFIFSSLVITSQYPRTSDHSPHTSVWLISEDVDISDGPNLIRVYQTKTQESQSAVWQTQVSFQFLGGSAVINSEGGNRDGWLKTCSSHFQTVIFIRRLSVSESPYFAPFSKAFALPALTPLLRRSMFSVTMGSVNWGGSRMTLAINLSSGRESPCFPRGR